MRTTRLLATGFLAILILAISTPLATTKTASAEYTTNPALLQNDGTWAYVQNDFITVAFPADGKKPMFLWWYNNDQENINVVKFKGLIEYVTYAEPFFLRKCQAEAGRIRQLIEAHYYEPWRHIRGREMMMGRAMEKLWKIGNATGLHAPYLPFSSSRWALEGPENVTRGDVRYLSFNFTLMTVPGLRTQFRFAEGNVIIRCRFYYTAATESAHGQYNYNVNAGELKIDLIIRHWEWNIDKLEPIVHELRALGFDIPEGKAGLAMWVNLASINSTNLETAEKDAETTADTELTETVSNARNLYVEGDKVSVLQNNVQMEDEIPMQNRWRERFNIRFERGNATFGGFFKFVPQAIITDGFTYNTTDVTASYISAGGHMRLFIGYPYFGNYTLEHDPSLGVEGVAPWLPTGLLLILFGGTLVIAAVVAATRIRKKTVNFVGLQ